MAILSRRSWPAVILMATTLAACEHTPATPSETHTSTKSSVATPTPTPTPAFIVEAFHLEGILTNDDGQPVANAQVAMNTCDKVTGATCVLPVKVTYATTDAEGRYAMDVQAVRGLYQAGVIGLAYASVGGDQLAHDLQFVTAPTAQVVKNFRLSQDINLEPGEKVTATFTPDASLCGDVVLNMVCRFVRLNVPADGTLTLSAVPLDGTAGAALFFSADDPIGSGFGTLTFSAKAGVYNVDVAIPPVVSGSPSYSISAAFQPKSQ